MVKRSFILVFFVIMMILSAAFSVSGQDIDVSSMDNEELSVLLQQILSRLEQTGSAGAEASETDPSAAPAASSAAPERPKFSIWKNKKLIVEAMPGYMFVQKTTEEPDTTSGPNKPGETKKKDNTGDHYTGEPCGSGGATWWYTGSFWECGYG